MVLREKYMVLLPTTDGALRRNRWYVVTFVVVFTMELLVFRKDIILLYRYIEQARNSPEQPGTARSSPEQPGAARSNPEHPGAAGAPRAAQCGVHLAERVWHTKIWGLFQGNATIWKDFRFFYSNLSLG